jgi:hypothetical protein
MKKYISAIIIDAMLIQLTGCYSWETVKTPQQNSTIKIITKDSTQIDCRNGVGIKPKSILCICLKKINWQKKTLL